MKSRARFVALLGALAGASLSGQAPAPVDQGPTFKVRVDYVEVDALVTDAQGRFVRDLKKEDFQVLEDGKPQTVSAFTLVDIPIERPDQPPFVTQPIEPDVRTNARPFDGRVYVMVIDDNHTAFERTERVKTAARQFVQRNLGANDLMAIVHTAGRSDASQDFTGSKRRLIAAIDKTIGDKVQSQTESRTQEFNNTIGIREPGDSLIDRMDPERGQKARSSLDTLKRVADWFAGVRGRRKTILFVSEGIDYDVTDPFNNRQSSSILDATRDAVASAQRANVSIYAIDPRGLSSSLGDASEGAPVDANDQTPSLGNTGINGPVMGYGVGPRSTANELRLSQESLRVVADQTGGFAVINRNEYAGAYQRIVEDNSSYYVLAYYPPTDKRDGRFHNIDVKVTRPGLTVRARRGYASSRARPAPALKGDPLTVAAREVLGSPLPISGLTMHVFAAPFKGTAPNASVLLGVELLGRDLKLEQNSKIAVSYVAIDATGRIRGGDTNTLTANLKPETKTRVQETGFRFLNRMDLPPGRYQVRVSAREGDSELTGAVLYDLDVPDFTKNPLVMSGVVLTSIAGSAVPTPRVDEQLKTMLPAPPAALRTFAQNDEVVLFSEVYDNTPSTPHKLDLATTITASDGHVVFRDAEERDSADLQGKRGGFGYTTRIPLRDIPPGSYVLKVEARSRLGSGATSEQLLQFAVIAGAPR